MARDFDGTDDVITLATEVEYSSSSKISIFAWIYLDSLTGFHHILGRRNSGTITYQFRVGKATGDGILWFGWTEGGTLQLYDVTPPTISVTTWTAVGVTFDYANPSGAAIYYKNGAATSVNRTSGTGTTPDDTGLAETIGRRNDTAMPFNGKIAELARWNRVLSAAEMTILGKGFSPAFVPNGLQYYAPLIGNYSPEIDVKGGNNGTVTEAVKADHPRIIYPTGGL